MVQTKAAQENMDSGFFPARQPIVIFAWVSLLVLWFLLLVFVLCFSCGVPHRFFRSVFLLNDWE